MTHPHPNRKFVPQAILTRAGKINTAGASVNTVVRPVNTAGSKPTVNHPRSISNAYKKGYSQVTRPFNINKNNNFNKNVNTVRVKDTTARDRAVSNPQQKEYKEKGVIDSGCSRHMTGNKCYLTEYEDYHGGFVSFRDGKDENSGILKTFITEIENQLDHKVKVIRSDNGTEFKNSNGIAERKNTTLIKAARTMVLVIKPHNKTPYELIRGRTPLIDFMKPFGCPVTILNTMDHLGKFDGKADEGFFVGYSMLFDVDSLSKSMNYVPVIAENQTNGIAGKRDNIVAGQAEKKIEPEQDYILIPICTTDPLISQDPKVNKEDA
ncbi:ribonuclease H-like domain-containing protein [Tanacetum coccineum]|uniref:Ribonuclease H-like domain-containing protein n=1 Tax=Tanacetum coccineum TaxID=301880 RepID=A0ABQ5IV25_9ASTR